MIKYRDNMTDQELEEFMHQLELEQGVYDTVDWGHEDLKDEDEMSLLRRAAFNCRGRP